MKSNVVGLNRPWSNVAIPDGSNTIVHREKRLGLYAEFGKKVVMRINFNAKIDDVSMQNGSAMARMTVKTDQMKRDAIVKHQFKFVSLAAQTGTQVE
jgi:hypothetical protein